MQYYRISCLEILLHLSPTMCVPYIDLYSNLLFYYAPFPVNEQSTHWEGATRLEKATEVDLMKASQAIT